METTAFQRFEAALGKKAPWLKHDEANGIDIKSLMKDRKAFKARQQKHENDLNAWVGELTAEVANLEKSVSPQAVAVIDAFVWGAGGKREKIKDASAQMTVRSLFLRAEHLRNAQAAAPTAKPTAPPVVPATASSAAPSKPATPMQLTPEIKAKGAAALAAVTNPATRGPAVTGLEKSIAEAAKPRPDFSFLHGTERAITAQEYDRLGGLTESRHAMYMYRRRQYCEKHHLTPEMVSGAAHVVIPEMIPNAEVNKREQQAGARKALPALTQRLHAINLRVIASAKQNGGQVSTQIVQERALLLQQVNKLEAILGNKLSA